MKISFPSVFSTIAFVFIGSFSIVQNISAQGMDGIERARMKTILKIVKDEVKKNYYDPNYHGINLDERFKAAEDKLGTATNTSQSLAIIAQVLIDFNDSHLYLRPPSTGVSAEYGWRMQAIGNKVFITQVKPGSDADAKGLKAGDQVLSVSGFKPSRKELWKVLYYYNVLSQREKLTLTVVGPGSESARDLEIKSQIKKQPQSITFGSYFRLFDDFYDERNDEHRFWTFGGTTVWKMPSFAIDPNQVDGLMDRAKGTGLILDLRGNGGGYVKTMEELVGNFFDKDIKVADMKERKKIDPCIAKTRGKSIFNGKLIVLLDSESGSASEIFARLIQLEKRGTVLGDVSAGAVMQSLSHSKEMGTQSIVLFGISVTNADVIMSDGKSLEHVGVIPDELILPTAADLAAGHDPVMARALDLLGTKMSPKDTGKLAKYHWKK